MQLRSFFTCTGVFKSSIDQSFIASSTRINQLIKINQSINSLPLVSSHLLSFENANDVIAAECALRINLCGFTKILPFFHIWLIVGWLIDWLTPNLYTSIITTGRDPLCVESESTTTRSGTHSAVRFDADELESTVTFYANLSTVPCAVRWYAWWLPCSRRYTRDGLCRPRNRWGIVLQFINQ